MLYKISSAANDKNVCRNLHRLIQREGLTLALPIDFVETPVRKRRPLVKKVKVWYPVIYPSKWVEFLMKDHGHLLLGGVDARNCRRWQANLHEFWIRYKQYDEQHIMNEASSPPTTHTVPIYLHGDEGRGKYKLPLMVECFQPLVSFRGTAFKNSSGPLTA